MQFSIPVPIIASMGHNIIILVVLVLLYLAVKLLPRILFVVFAKWVGKKAMESQVDAIHLTSKPGHVWADRAGVESLAAPLPALGFEEAGTYAIPEMAGVVVRLLAQPEKQIAAAIYEHPKAGTWIDFFSHYKDGGSFTGTTLADTGMDKRPGAEGFHSPGTSSEALYQRMLTERPSANLEEMMAATVVHRFEDAYARSAAWRRNRGISTREVAHQMQKRAANQTTVSANQP